MSISAYLILLTIALQVAGAVWIATRQQRERVTITTLGVHGVMPGDVLRVSGLDSLVKVERVDGFVVHGQRRCRW